MRFPKIVPALMLVALAATVTFAASNKRKKEMKCDMEDGVVCDGHIPPSAEAVGVAACDAFTFSISNVTDAAEMTHTHRDWSGGDDCRGDEDFDYMTNSVTPTVSWRVVLDNGYVQSGSGETAAVARGDSLSAECIFTVESVMPACGEAITNVFTSSASIGCDIAINGSPRWIGLDRTGDPDTPYASSHYDASATIEPDWDCVEEAGWEYSGVCEQKQESDWSISLWTTNREAASEAYESEIVTATALGSVATNRLTVVKVDVTIDGVGEDKEESDGALARFVPDAANGQWTSDGTNALVAVSITCEPQLPTNEVITITAPPKSLYIKRGNQYFPWPEEYDFPAYLLPDLQFVLHGHTVSSSLADLAILVEHKLSGAIDVAKYSNYKLSVTNIKFNHDVTSSTHDAINIRRSYADNIDIANGEWFDTDGATANEPICYTTNREVTVKARFEASNFITSAVIRAKCADAGGSLSSLLPTNVFFSGGVSSPEYIEFAMEQRTLSGIDRSEDGVLAWSADSINGKPGCKMNRSGPHLVYTILNEPVSPWNNDWGDQANAWTNALEWTCKWAKGCFDCTNVAKNVTQAINGSGKFAYETINGQSAYIFRSEFELTKGIERLNGGQGNGELVNCSDCASFVVSFANLAGCELYSSQMGDNFMTREYTAIGCHSWISPQWGWGFSYHEVAWTGQCQDSDLIFDACLKYNGNSDLTSTNKIEELPMSVQFSDGSVNEPFVYRERLAPAGSRGYDRCASKPYSKKRRAVK